MACWIQLIWATTHNAGSKHSRIVRMLSRSIDAASRTRKPYQTGRICAGKLARPLLGCATIWSHGSTKAKLQASVPRNKISQLIAHPTHQIRKRVLREPVRSFAGTSAVGPGEYASAPALPICMSGGRPLSALFEQCGLMMTLSYALLFTPFAIACEMTHEDSFVCGPQVGRGRPSDGAYLLFYKTLAVVMEGRVAASPWHQLYVHLHSYL